MRRRTYLLTAILLFAIIIPAGNVWADSNTVTYQNATATIRGPDTVEPNNDFTITITGKINNTSIWKVHQYRLYENAKWSYDSNHWITINSYDKVIEYSRYKWGGSFSKTYSLNREEGTYNFTFVFIDATRIHSGYSVAVDLNVEVKPIVYMPDDIDEYIQSLSDESFKNHNGNLKNSLHQKLRANAHQIFVEDWDSAIGKLSHDIKNTVQKWITDESAVAEILMMIETLYEWLLEQYD